MLQSVRFLIPNHPFSKGDETSLKKDVAEKLRVARIIEFVAPKKAASVAAPPAPPAPPSENETMVEIPDDWADLHHQKIMKLASLIIGETISNLADAKGTIKDELARRAASPE